MTDKPETPAHITQQSIDACPEEIIAGDSLGYSMWRLKGNDYLILDNEASYVRYDLYAAMVARAGQAEAENAELRKLRQADAMTVTNICKEAVQLRAINTELAGALERIGPFELVQGDTARRLNPSAQWNLNTSAAWLVSQETRSAHEARTILNFIETALQRWRDMGGKGNG